MPTRWPTQSPSLARCGALLITTLTMFGCGGDDDPAGPEAPAAVATVLLSPSALSMVAGEEETLQVTLSDADGNVLTGRTVVYASSEQSVVAVDDSGRVTAIGKGTATVTATSEGRAGTASADVEWSVLSPTESMSISGTTTYASISVPENVVITMVGNGAIVSEGPVDISGQVAGNCAELTIAGTDVTVTGTVNNRCLASTDLGPALSIIAKGTLTLIGAGIGSSGAVIITNDTTLTDSDFDLSLAAPARADAYGAAAGACVVDGLVPVLGRVSQTSWGADTGDAGGDGQDSGDWLFDCNGDIEFRNGGVIDTPDAGNGGEGSDASAPADKVETRGGKGGNGGRLRVRSTGSITFKSPPAGGGPVILRLAHGGDEGEAFMAAGTPGGDAKARGGDGGNSGTLKVQANGGITIEPKGLEIVVGQGGKGGGGVATGADGADAGSAEAQIGGDAEGIGGSGGDTPDAQLRARGNVSGAAEITLSGGDGGGGGLATAHSGEGGQGNSTFPDGANGGDLVAVGGDGGDALTADLAGAGLGHGGDGGEGKFSGGGGGVGFDGCFLSPAAPGGNGGEGGNASGMPGGRGSGVVFGGAADVLVEEGTGDGGYAGDGSPAGSGGVGGTDDIGLNADGARIDVGPNFVRGVDGTNCKKVTVNTGSLPTSFTHQVGTTSCPQTIGTFTITNNDASETVTWFVETSAPLGLTWTGGSGVGGGGSLMPGATVEITVVFDCSQTTSFSRSITIGSIDSTGTVTQMHTIAGTVN